MAQPTRHRILQQRIEVAGCSHGNAAAVQAVAAVIFQRDWLPIVERLFDQQVDADRVLRIDRLDIDLGHLPASVWLGGSDDGVAIAAAGGSGSVGESAALAQAFEAEFSRSLDRALTEATEVQADHELLEFYLHTGALPWWADTADRQAVSRAVVALAGQPAAVWRLLLAQPGASASAPPALQRLVAVMTDAQLGRLLAQWLGPPGENEADHGWTAALQPAWLAALDATALALGHAAVACRKAWWWEALAVTLWPPAGEGRHWWPTVLDRWSGRLALPPGVAQQALRTALDRAALPGDAIVLAPLWRALAVHSADAIGAPGAAAPTEAVTGRLLQALLRLAATGHADAAGWRHLHDCLKPAWPRLPASLWPPVAHALARQPADRSGRSAAAAPQGTALQALEAALQRLLQQAWQQGLIDPARLAGADRAADPSPSPAPLSAAWATALAASLASDGVPGDGAVVLATASAGRPGVVEALYIAHAGLVLLWPFVQRFVGRLGLSQAGPPVRWRNPAAARRAAVLLHCAISGDADPPEFQLPLAKLLCGLPLDEPVLLDAPLTDEEQAECDALLVAAIAQAPILRNMSVAGFRGSFGQREGQLRSRDGHWLLQVERQAYDVVIDRFPWSVGLIRLPWMPVLLQVRW